MPVDILIAKDIESVKSLAASHVMGILRSALRNTVILQDCTAIRIANARNRHYIGNSLQSTVTTSADTMEVDTLL